MGKPRNPTPPPTQVTLNIADLQSMIASQLSQVTQDLQAQMARQSYDFKLQLEAERDNQQMERRRLQLQHSQEMRALKAAMTPAPLPPEPTQRAHSEHSPPRLNHGFIHQSPPLSPAYNQPHIFACAGTPRQVGTWTNWGSSRHAENSSRRPGTRSEGSCQNSHQESSSSTSICK